MSEPLTPQKVEAGIRDSINKLGELVHQYAAAGDAKATTDADFKIAWAKARTLRRSSELMPKPTESVLEDYATLETEDQLRARLSAAATEEAIKLGLRAMTSRLDAMRSLAANLREVT